MESVDATRTTYEEKIEKSPDFAKEVKVFFSDDVSTDVMKKFQGGKDWMQPMIRELILDWNLTDAEGNKLPIATEGLDRIKSIKLRNWIIQTMQDVIVNRMSVIKKK